MGFKELYWLILTTATEAHYRASQGGYCRTIGVSVARFNIRIALFFVILWQVTAKHPAFKAPGT